MATEVPFYCRAGEVVYRSYRIQGQLGVIVVPADPEILGVGYRHPDYARANLVTVQWQDGSQTQEHPYHLNSYAENIESHRRKYEKGKKRLAEILAWFKEEQSER